MIYGSVCSGIEAASVAWAPLGWQASFLSEIEPFPRAVLKHHYPEIPCHGDFTTIGAGDYGPIDLLVGGTPCQSFSVAGLRGGLADKRGNLALEFLRLAVRLRPRWIVWENVSGVLSSTSHDAPDPSSPPDDMAEGSEWVGEDEYDADEGHAFSCFLAGLSEIGYGFAYRSLDAQYFHLAQRRERVFVVGYLGDWRRAAAVLFEPASLRGDTAPIREARQTIASAIRASASPNGHGNSSGLRGDGTDNLVDIARALRDQPNSSHRVDSDNFVTSGFFRDISHSLNAHGQRLDYETETLVAFQAKASSTGSMNPSHISPTLDASKIGGVCVSFAIQERAVSENLKNGPQGKGFQADVAYTLEARNKVQAVATSLVRRLKPLECERLQGFLDHYTDVVYRGKRAADGPRYKALGNSMAVPVMRWIGRRIQRVDTQ